MITQEFLSQCSDEQINKGVAWLEAINLDINTMQRLIIISAISRRIFKSWRVFHPCTNPNDIMPIAFSNRINLISPLEHKDKWAASATKGGGNWSINDFKAVSTNPLRAICEVYILMSVNK